jgi:hypothetical protein
MTKLFLIIHTDIDGDNFDLLVRADNASEAVSFWIAYFEFDRGQIQETGPVKVYAVPDAGSKGAVPWHEPDGLRGTAVNPATVPVLPAPVYSQSEAPTVWVAVYEGDDRLCWIEAFDSEATADAHRDKIVAGDWPAGFLTGRPCRPIRIRPQRSSSRARKANTCSSSWSRCSDARESSSDFGSNAPVHAQGYGDAELVTDSRMYWFFINWKAVAEDIVSLHESLTTPRSLLYQGPQPLIFFHEQPRPSDVAAMHTAWCDAECDRPE